MWPREKPQNRRRLWRSSRQKSQGSQESDAGSLLARACAWGKTLDYKYPQARYLRLDFLFTRTTGNIIWPSRLCISQRRVCFITVYFICVCMCYKTHTNTYKVHMNKTRDERGRLHVESLRILLSFPADYPYKMQHFHPAQGQFALRASSIQ